MEILPVRNSVDSLFYRGIEHLNQSENGFVRHAVTRAVQMVAIPPIMVLSVLYNVLAIALKAPMTLARYTIGFIPTEKGKLADMFPEDSTASHMAWHAYKVILFWIDIVPLYLVGIIHPGANVFIHKKMALIPSITIGIEVDKTSPETPGVRIELTVPVPPRLPPVPPKMPPPNWKSPQKPSVSQPNQAGVNKGRPLPQIPWTAQLKSAIANKQKKMQELEEAGNTIDSLVPKKDKMVGLFNVSALEQKINAVQQKNFLDDDSLSDSSSSWGSEWDVGELPDYEPSHAVDDTLAAILNAPKVTFKIEEIAEVAPVQVVPNEIASSDHYKKMAILHKMQEEDSDDSDWEDF